jgi:carboxyl-terminal processing protease
MLEGDIAYIQLLTFGEKTTDELKKAIRTLKEKNPRGLILVLRNNGGGFLNTAIEVASQSRPLMLSSMSNTEVEEKKTFNTIPGGIAKDIPMVVLINGGSASASEIVAGALQDSGRAKLVGEKSYGKGSVQNWIPLINEQGAVRITVASWVTPKERQINEEGLKPDVEIKLTEEDVKAQNDIQLKKAIEILTK